MEKILCDDCFRECRKIRKIIVECVSVDAAFQNDILYCNLIVRPLIQQQNEGGLDFISCIGGHTDSIGFDASYAWKTF
jgi:hypothetical protein